MLNIVEVTYEDYDLLSGTSVLNLEHVLNLFDQLNWKKGTFMYFPIDAIQVFQVHHHDSSRLVLEVLNDSPLMIFDSKYVSKSECATLIEQCFATGQIDLTTGFYKVQINKESLDQVMRRK